jgi:hypothetical protein
MLRCELFIIVYKQQTLRICKPQWYQTCPYKDTIVPKIQYFFILSVIKWIKDFEVLMEWISNVLVLERLVLIENAWSRRTKHVLDRYTEKYQTTHTVQLTKKKNSYIYFITMVCAVLCLSSFLFSLIMHFQLELVSQELTHLRSIPLVLQNT